MRIYAGSNGIFRSIRAGLGNSSQTGIEPRGDLDVVLSMRALQSPISPRSNPSDGLPNGSVVRPEGSISPTQSQFTDASRSSPTSSLSRSQSLAHSGTTGTFASGDSTFAEPVVNSASSSPARPAMSTATAIKSLFAIGGGRPRSPSSASISNSAPVVGNIEEFPEDSFAHAGISLLGMMQDRPMTPVIQSATPRAGTPSLPAETHSIFLERKILPDSDRHQLEQNISPTPTPALDIPRRRDSSLTVARESLLVAPHRVSTDGAHYSPSLQPPPRKRAGTVSTVALSVSSPSESESYHYAHANRSTAESLGVQNPHLLTPSPPMPPPLPLASARTKDRRARASWSSVSTYGSNDQSPSLPDEVRSRRWSRRGSLPQRISPPYPTHSSPSGSPKSQNLRMLPVRHPYAAEMGPLTRSPSTKSDYMSDIQPRAFSAKRASASSVQSFSSTTSPVPTLGSAVGLKFGQRPRSSHRASMPPPQRPAPNVALPPTPGDNDLSGTASTSPISEVSSSPPTKMSSFRESLLQRSKRHSGSPASPPPSVGLPPRPDEATIRPTHGRTPSHGSIRDLPTTGSLLVSPTGTLGQPAFPPPSGPLPPTPQLPSAPGSPTQSSRHSSLKRRFRRISLPASTTVAIPSGSPEAQPISFLPSQPSPIMEVSIHPVPIGEPITTSQNDPDFLNLASPPTPTGSVTAVSVDTKPPQEMPEVGPIALSPPPRRASRQPAPPEPEPAMEGEASAESVSTETEKEKTQVQPDVDDVLRPPPEVDDFAPSSSL